MYSVEIENRCLREMKKLDHWIVNRALALIEEVIAKDPYSGKKLRGKYSGLFSYRFSDYRIIYEIRKKNCLWLFSGFVTEKMSMMACKAISANVPHP